MMHKAVSHASHAVELQAPGVTGSTGSTLLVHTSPQTPMVPVVPAALSQLQQVKPLPHVSSPVHVDPAAAPSWHFWLVTSRAHPYMMICIVEQNNPDHLHTHIHNTHTH